MKTIASIQINLPKPCHENWNEMTEVERGRFCNACQKTVIDFRNFSDEELFQFYSDVNNREVCGRFYGNQLNKHIYNQDCTSQQTFPKQKFRNKIAAGILFLNSVVTGVFAQIKPTQPNAIHGSDASLYVSGKVLNSLSLKPVPNVEVFIGSNLKGVTNKYGRFKIKLPADYANNSIPVYVAYNDSVQDTTANIILSDTVSFSEVQQNITVTLYQYPMSRMDKTEIIAYKPPLVRQESYTLGMPAITSSIKVYKKPSLWQRIKYFFKKKNSE